MHSKKTMTFVFFFYLSVAFLCSNIPPSVATPRRPDLNPTAVVHNNEPNLMDNLYIKLDDGLEILNPMRAECQEDIRCSTEPRYAARLKRNLEFELFISLEYINRRPTHRRDDQFLNEAYIIPKKSNGEPVIYSRQSRVYALPVQKLTKNEALNILGTGDFKMITGASFEQFEREELSRSTRRS